MKSLVRHIEYLLTQHDCVIVPGWGAWMVQYSAAVAETTATLLPPRRWLSFNATLSHNDGTLAHSVMRAEGCSYDDAVAYIADVVASWHATLHDEGQLVMGRIGRFTPQEDGTMLFAEAQESMVNLPYAWLPTVTLSHLDAQAEPEDEAIEPEEVQPATISWHRRVWQAAASVAAIVIALLFISTPIDNYQVTNDYASMVELELFGGESAVVSVDNTPIRDEDFAIEIIADNIDFKEVVDDETASVELDKEKRLPRYILVIGSLPTRGLAEKQIAHFKHLGVTDEIHIYEREGKARLFIEGFDSLDEAQTRVNTLVREENTPFSGVWICATC